MAANGIRKSVGRHLLLLQIVRVRYRRTYRLRIATGADGLIDVRLRN